MSQLIKLIWASSNISLDELFNVNLKWEYLSTKPDESINLLIASANSLSKLTWIGFI